MSIGPSFDDAVTRLNSRNLPFLLRLCAYLSALEASPDPHSPIVPLWNFEKQRLFTDAILASRAAPYKEGRFTTSDFRYVVNAANNALADPRLNEIESGQDRKKALLELHRFFGRTANIQLRHQDYRFFMTVGRLVGMFEALPLQATDEYPRGYRQQAREFPNQVKTVLGASIFDLFLLHVVAWRRSTAVRELALRELAKHHPDESTRVESSRDKQMRHLLHLISLFSRFEHSVVFRAENLQATRPTEIPESATTAYLRLFSRSVRELREEAQHPAYHYGPRGLQLSPVERYPIVQIDGEEGNYCIPNVRAFLRSFPDVIHFTLQSALGDSYNMFRGYSYEVYLRRLVERRLPNRCVISERPYKKPLGEFRGPDLTIVEEPRPRLVLIEAKARRLRAETRFTLTDEALDENYDEVYRALHRLKEKVNDLFAGLREYEDVQPCLNSAKHLAPFAVIVLGEATFLMTELIRGRAEGDPDHTLAGYPYPFCVLGPEGMELAVEFAALEGRPLTAVLEEIWTDSGSLELDEQRSDRFRGRGIDEWSTFAASFLKPLLRAAGFGWGNVDQPDSP